MKENKYDAPRFSEKYSQMARSQQGLAGAGKRHELEKLLPDFSGRSVLDLAAATAGTANTPVPPVFKKVLDNCTDSVYTERAVGK